LPYDADHSFADEKFVGYKVGPNVIHHKASGLGIYSNFRDHNIVVETAIQLPNPILNNGIQLKNMFTVKLDNKGSISSVVNGRGPGPLSDTERGVPHRCSDSTCEE
jgi:hypothetical protein